MLYVIGCGGVGSWLVPKLKKLQANHDHNIMLVDGDTLEKKNLDRQLFTEENIGRNKADCLAEKYGTASLPEFFHSGLDLGIRPDDILFCCADNHACRREVLTVCDATDCRAVFGANEYTDAEAYWYERNWKDGPNDPRVFYPVILSDRSYDPLSPEGCTGESQVRSPQLVIANDWASGLMLQLYWFHTNREEHRETAEFWPVHHKVNLWKFHTIKQGERK